MAYVTAIPKEDATGELKKIYDDYLNNRGYIPNYARAMSPRIEVFEAWRNLEESIKTNLSFRMYELVTLAAASALKSTYCMLSHGA